MQRNGYPSEKCRLVWSLDPYTYFGGMDTSHFIKCVEYGSIPPGAKVCLKEFAKYLKEEGKTPEFTERNAEELLSEYIDTLKLSVYAKEEMGIWAMNALEKLSPNIYKHSAVAYEHDESEDRDNSPGELNLEIKNFRSGKTAWVRVDVVSPGTRDENPHESEAPEFDIGIVLLGDNEEDITKNLTSAEKDKILKEAEEEFDE